MATIELIDFIYYITSKLTIIILSLSESIIIFLIIMFQRFKKDMRKTIFSIIQIISLLLLVDNCIDMTIDYLNFDYIYKMDVLDKDIEHDFPGINVCTESKTLFSRQKVMTYFDATQEYSLFKTSYAKIEMTINEIEENLEILENLRHYEKRDFDYHGNESQLNNMKASISQRNYNLSQFFILYEKYIFAESNFDEINQLIVRANNCFQCSAHYYSENNTFAQINGCFDVKETIVWNNDFGICYSLFNKKYKIVLNKKDFIEIKLNISKLEDFIIRAINITDNRFFNPYLDGHFILYYFLDNSDLNRYPNKEIIEKSYKINFNTELTFSKTTFQYLSTPYMENCNNHGELTNSFLSMTQKASWYFKFL